MARDSNLMGMAPYRSVDINTVYKMNIIVGGDRIFLRVEACNQPFTPLSSPLCIKAMRSVNNNDYFC